MLSEPSDLDPASLIEALARWELRAPELVYLPVGFGSHHWRAGDWFVSVDDLEADFQRGPGADASFAALERAFETAAVLRERAGLEFVVAPLRDRDGVVLRRVSARYAVRVEPFVAGESAVFGPYASSGERRSVAAALGRLHAASVRVPARREDFALPARGVLDDLDRPWDGGPYGERAQELVRSHARDLERRLEEYDALVARVRAKREPWVVTHGEPHRANVIRGTDGAVHLVDWDTALVAPRERDLHMVLDADVAAHEEYGTRTVDTDALRLYRLWWQLADITVFAAGFRRSHEESDDSAAAWDVLSRNLRALTVGE
jgi:spectinomycin phosphotransferase